MATSIAQVIAQVKSSVGKWITPELIRELCQEVGHQWRERVLDPVTTLQLFVLQIVCGNTACAHVPRLANIDCTGEAYGQARSRLPLALFHALLTRITQSLPVSSTDAGRWRGHRTFLLDGSSASMSDTPELQRAFGQPATQAPGCGFPQMRLMAMFQATTGFLLSIVSSPCQGHDISQVTRVHPDLEADDILVGDRGLCSFAHLAKLGLRGVFGLFRTHQSQIVDFKKNRRHARGPRRRPDEKGLPTSRWIQRLGRQDQLVDYVKPKDCPKWMTAEEYAALPETIRVREIRYKVTKPGSRTKEVTLTTTLLDPVKYPAAEVADLYGQRWEIETDFKHLKTTLKMDVLHCKTVEGVEKELIMYALVYNLIRLVMLEASRRQRVAVERISFVDAARWLAQALQSDRVPPLKLRVNPHRPNRAEPRARKRRPKPYPPLKKPRDEMRKQLKNKGKTAKAA